jgi:hypothetical protein
MSENQPDPQSCYFYIRATLECGSQLLIAQRQLGVPWEFILTLKEGAKLEDSIRIVDNKLKINMEQESAIGLYQLLSLILAPKRRKFLGLF